MQNGQLVGSHNIIFKNEELGISVVQTKFGLHVLGKNDQLLASKVGGSMINMDRGVAEHYAIAMENAIINRDLAWFTHVYYQRTFKKGA